MPAVTATTPPSVTGLAVVHGDAFAFGAVTLEETGDGLTTDYAGWTARAVGRAPAYAATFERDLPVSGAGEGALTVDAWALTADDWAAIPRPPSKTDLRVTLEIAPPSGPGRTLARYDVTVHPDDAP